MTTGLSAKQFEIWQSERSYRFKEEAIYNHAPQAPGIYQLVTFDEQQNSKVVFMALTEGQSVFDALFAHWRGGASPGRAGLASALSQPILQFRPITTHLFLEARFQYQSVSFDSISFLGQSGSLNPAVDEKTYSLQTGISYRL